MSDSTNIQADGALGEHLTTMWIHFTGWDGFSQEIFDQFTSNDLPSFS